MRSKHWGSEPHSNVLCRCTRAIIFLGTPHKGAGLANWFSRLAQVVGLVKQANTNILKQLNLNSDELSRIQEEFDIFLRSRANDEQAPIQIKCFYEEQPVTGVGIVGRPMTCARVSG